MKLYKASGEGKFSMAEGNSTPSKELVKIRVTKVLPSRSDLDIFKGKAKINYPIVPCHMAIGVVSEERADYGLKRGAKVILNPYVSAHLEKLDVLPEVTTFGYDTDGFLADFVSLPIENVIPFPEEIKENEAIFSEYVSIALSAINCFRVEKGDYIVIIGGSPLCNLIGQFALYFQAIPILIDNDPIRLQSAEDCGIYYTVNTTIEVPYDRVLEITGGRMAEHTIMESSEFVNANYLFTLARHGGDCTIVSINGYLNPLDADLNYINNRQLKVKGISNGAGEFNSAVYLLAQKFLKLAPLVEQEFKDGANFDQVFADLESKSMAIILNI